MPMHCVMKNTTTPAAMSAPKRAATLGQLDFAVLADSDDCEGDQDS
jgi:hypothetical protein